MSDIKTVWVLWYRYTDGSGAGVVRAYSSEDRAQLDLELLQGNDGFKAFEVEELPVYGDAP